MGNTWEPLGSAEIGGHEKHDWKMVNIPYACFFGSTWGPFLLETMALWA